MRLIKTFAAKLSYRVLMIVSILFVLALGVVAISSQYLMSEEAKLSASHVLEASVGNIENTFNNVETTIQNTAWLVTENKDDADYIYHITRKIVEESPYIVGSSIAFDSCVFENRHFFAPYTYEDNSTHELISKQLGTQENNYFEQEWFYEPFNSGNPHWSEPYFDAGGGMVEMTTYSFPVRNEQGKVYAIITADIALDWMSKIIGDIHPYPNSYAILISQKGHVLSVNSSENNSDESAIAVIDNDDDAKNLVNEMMSGKSGEMRIKSNGSVGFAIFGPVSNGWSLAIISQYRDVLYGNFIMNMVLVGIGVVGLILLFVVCWCVIKKFTRPLSEFSEAALNVAKGDFATRLPEIHTNDELQQLHDSLDRMRQSIVKYIEELKVTTKANERMESELNIATSIQRGILSNEFISNEKFSLHAYLSPAREVGGDLYDFLVRDNRLYFTIGDVSGKGVPAALVMAITTIASRFFAGLKLRIDETTSRLNATIAERNTSNMFVTMLIGGVNLETYKMRLCNAGHNPIIIIPPDDKPYYYKAKTNIAIGIIDDFEYQADEVQLSKGTKLLLYTDGVVEAETVDKELYGEERFLDLVSSPEFKNLSAEGMTDAVRKSVKEFTGDNEQNDDITIMAITL